MAGDDHVFAPKALRGQDWSSSKIRSRTQCRRVSIPQWPRTGWPARSASRAAEEVQERVSVCGLPPRSMQASTRAMQATPGQAQVAPEAAVAGQPTDLSHDAGGALFDAAMTLSCVWAFTAPSGAVAKQALPRSMFVPRPKHAGRPGASQSRYSRRGADARRPPASRRCGRSGSAPSRVPHRGGRVRAMPPMRPGGVGRRAQREPRPTERWR